MTKQVINIGSSANDGSGTPNRDSFDICNDNFTELYSWVSEIQYINELAASDVSNSSDSVPVSTGLEVTITPKLSTSKLIVSFFSNWEFVSSQEGCQVKYEYSTDNYSTSTVVTSTLYQTATGTQRRDEISGQIEIPNPGQEIKCRIIFLAQTNTFNATYKGTRGGLISIAEKI